MRFLPGELEEILNSCGLPWRIEDGSRHHKIYVGNRLAGVIPKGKSRNNLNTAHKNMIAQVRRAIRGQRP